MNGLGNKKKTTGKLCLCLTNKNKKLLQFFYDKKNYNVHYFTLKLYISLGLVVIDVHRVIKVVQRKWLAGYIELNLNRRAESNNMFDENFYKLLIKSVYGKMCENRSNRANAFLVQTEDELLKLHQNIFSSHSKYLQKILL